MLPDFVSVLTATPPRHRMSLSPMASRAAAWIAGIVTLVVLVLLDSQQSFPPIPRSLTLVLTFPEAAVGRVEPILCTGMFMEGDLLVVRYTSESTVVISYDHWGTPGLMSEPIAFRPGARHV